MFNVWGYCLDHHLKSGDLSDSLSLTLTQQHWRPKDGRGQLTTSCSQSLANLGRTADTSTQAAQFSMKKQCQQPLPTGSLYNSATERLSDPTSLFMTTNGIICVFFHGYVMAFLFCCLCTICVCVWMHASVSNKYVTFYVCTHVYVYLLSSAVYRVAQGPTVCPCACEATTLNMYCVYADRPSTW